MSKQLHNNNDVIIVRYFYDVVIEISCQSDQKLPVSDIFDIQPHSCPCRQQ